MTPDENETVQTGEPQQEQQAENTQQPDPNAAESVRQEADEHDDDEGDEGDSNGEESGQGQRQKPKRPRWSDVNRANRRAFDLEDENRALRQRLEQAANPQQQQQDASEQEADEFPTLEDCNFDPEEQKRRITAWNQRQVAKQIENIESQRQSQATAQERQAAFASKEAEFIAAHPDYESVAKAPDVPITVQMAQVMFENPETAPAIAYWLGNNKAEAARISQMPALAAARAIGAIEARLSTTKANPPPKPVKPVPAVVPSLQAGASQKSWAQLSPEEHRARLREQKSQGR